MTPLQAGDKAPPFELSGTPAAPVSLASFRGRSKVVLMFFPLAWSPVCSREMGDVRADYPRYRELGAEVIGVSVDSLFALRAWAAATGIEYPLLSDFNREVSASYGALYDDFYGMRGVSKRAAFVIDREGIVRHAEVCESSDDLPDFAAVVRTLEALG